MIPLKSGGALTRLHLHSSVAANANLVTAGCWVHSARGTYPSRGGTAEQARTQSRLEQVKHTTIDHLPTSQAIVFYLSITELEACDCAAVGPNLGPVLAVPTGGSVWSRWDEERGGRRRGPVAAAYLEQRPLQSTECDGDGDCTGSYAPLCSAKLSIRVCGLEGRRSAERGLQSICASAAGTGTGACRQPTDRETPTLISAASVLALTATAQSAVACRVESSQSGNPFRINACICVLSQGTLRNRSALPSARLGPNLHRTA